MKVRAKLNDVTIPLGNTGITFAISENVGDHAGSLRIGKASGEWRPGKTQDGNGHKFKLDELLAVIEEKFPK